MFRNFEKKDLALIAVLLDKDEAKKKRKRRVWIHSILKTRKEEGEFHTLYRQLVDDETKFYRYFRMSTYQFNYLLTNIECDIKKQNTTFREAISPKEELAVCLRFLATGDAYTTIASSYRLGDSTVQKIVVEVCQAINNKMQEETMPMPTENDWKRIASEFWNTWNFPNCLGALDGKHVIIEAPHNSGSEYFIYKKTFSVVLMALVDAQYKFIAVDIGSRGRNSAGGILANSKLGKALEKRQLNVPDDRPLPGKNDVMPYVIVGDEAFPLKTYLLRPYPGSQINGDVDKQVYNYRHSRARRVSENAFGILAQKFRLYNRRLKLDPKNADLIILTTCILHNFIKDQPDPQPNLEQHNLVNIRRQGGSAEAAAFHIREAFKAFFMSANGRVEWQ